jgi:hypothetical protein
MIRNRPALLAAACLLARLALAEGNASPPRPAPGAVETAPEFPLVTLPARVDAIEVRGLWRTQDQVVLRELPFRPGDTVSAEAWALALERLWIIRIFSRIDARVEDREGRRVAVFELEERWTINLLFRFGAGGGAGWLRLGTYDINTVGGLIEAGGLWERFGDSNGGQLWLRNPRLFDQRQELALVVERLVRPRNRYAVVRTAAQLEFLREIHDRWRWGVRLDALQDEFIPNADAPSLGPGPTGTLLAGGSMRFGRLTTVRIRDDGWQLEVRPTLGLSTDATTPVFAQVWSELRAFRSEGPWNLGLRAQAGLQTPGAQFQHRFHLGGLDLLRGYPDNFVRTAAFALFNLEARLVAFDSTWFACLPTAFVDGSLSASEAGGVAPAFSAGVGVRFLVPRLVNSGLRIDAAFPLNLPLERAQILSVGIFQFF